MRLLWVALVWLVILGGLYSYMQAREYFILPPVNAVEILPAPGKFELEVTPTFDAQGGVDEFALELSEQPALVVTLNGREIVRHKAAAKAGVPLRFTWNLTESPVQEGKNEFRVSMPAATGGDASAFRGARLRLLRDNDAVTDSMIWSQPGAPVMGDVDVVVPLAAAAKPGHAH